MIIPMIKYHFLIYHQDYESFLEKVQAFGVLDIVYENQDEIRKDDVSTEAEDKLKQCLSFLTQYEHKNSIKIKEKLPIEEFLSEFNSSLEDFNNLNTKEADIEKEILKLKPWGQFNKAKLNEFNNFGYQSYFATCPGKQFDLLKTKDLFIEEISQHQGQVYFLVLLPSNQSFGELELEEINLPDSNLTDLENEIKFIKNKIQTYKELFQNWFISYKEDIENYIKEIQATADFQKALIETQYKADDKLRILTGWVPKTEETSFQKFLETNQVAYLSRRADPKDKNIPIKLINNKFAKLFEPIGNMFAMPDYKELDMTPFFAPFFMLFFGFCLGDAGYGIVYLLGSSLLKLKVKDPSKRRLLSLVQFLGGSTIFFGILTGTFFGISLLKIESLGNIRSIMLDSGTVFNLALIIGLFQIYIGIIIRAANEIRQFGFVYGLSAIGWLFLIPFGLDAAKFHFTGIIGTILTFFGLFLIVFYSDPKAGIFGRLGKGIWDLYNVTGLFGDVLSYIRLFALGVSSSILGLVVNDIGLQIKGSIPILGPIFFVIFIIAGHAGNMMLSSLGSFVHPMRLTFVEFYKNAGFAGGGKKYQPFTKKL